MLARVIARSFRLRRRQLLVAAAAVLLASTLISALGTLSLQMERKAGKELEAYGANLLLAPRSASLDAGVGGLAFGDVREQGAMPEQALEVLDSGLIEGVRVYAPYLFALAEVGERKVMAAGTQFHRLKAIAPYWQIEGAWAQEGAEGSAMVGRKAAAALSLRPGDLFNLSFREGARQYRVTGLVDVGGSEDNQVFVDLGSVQDLSGRPGQIDLVQIRTSSGGRSPAATAAELEQALPGVEARLVRQMAEAEQNVLFKVQLLLGLVAAIVLLAAAAAVFSTMTGSVLQRTKEIGLMKALGARDSRVALVFLAEAWAGGLVGGLLGNILGLALAQVVGRSVFSTYLSPQAPAAAATLLAALALTTLASLGPLRRALSVDPIIALRGE